MFSVTIMAVSPVPHLFVFLGEGGGGGRFNVMLLAFLTLLYSTVWQNCFQKPRLLSLRLSDPDKRAILIEEADLCVSSCLRILKSVTELYSNFEVVLECLKNIEVCVSFWQDRAILDKENKRLAEKMKETMEDCFQVSTKWCKKYLFDHDFPCYDMAKAEKELRVCICCLRVVCKWLSKKQDQNNYTD